MNLLRRFTLFLLVAAVLAGCGGTPAATVTPVPAQQTEPTEAAPATTAPATATEIPTAETTAESTTAASAPEATTGAAGAASGSDAAIIASMQEAVDNFNAAYNENDEGRLLAAIDQKNAPFKRSMLERFENSMESQFAGMFNLEGKVTEIRPRDKGYYEATIATVPALSTGQEGQVIKKWVFKEVAGKWVLSEPRRAELGKKLKYETEHFTIEHYKWDEEIMPEIGKILETAHTTVKTKLKQVPEEKLTAVIYPTYESVGISSAGWVGSYRAGRNVQQDRMAMRSPLSFGFIKGWPAEEDWVPELQDTMTHEFTHLVVQRSFKIKARLSDWMSEGLAEHVADAPRPGEIATAFEKGTIVPILDKKSQAVYKQDLEHFTLLEANLTLGYAQAYELVDLIYQEKGGYEGWWQFVAVYDRTQNIEETIRDQFNMSLEEFEAKYHEFMKKKYGID